MSLSDDDIHWRRSIVEHGNASNNNIERLSDSSSSALELKALTRGLDIAKRALPQKAKNDDAISSSTEVSDLRYTSDTIRSSDLDCYDQSRPHCFRSEENGPIENLSEYLASQFHRYQADLRKKLTLLKDQNGKPLYPDSDIDHQLYSTQTTTNADENTFGLKASIGYISGFAEGLMREDVSLAELISGGHECF
ncbi:hypothetical protein V2G26_010776 [Clonostachys chloroleuca]